MQKHQTWTQQEKIAQARRVIRQEQKARNAYEDDKRMSNHAHWIGAISDLNDLAQSMRLNWSTAWGDDPDRPAPPPAKGGSDA